MGLTHLVVEKSDNCPVEMSIVKPIDLKKIQGLNMKINVIIGLVAIFFISSVYAAFLLFNKNAWLEQEVVLMKKEIDDLKIQCNNRKLMDEIKAFENQVFNDVTNVSDELDEMDEIEDDEELQTVGPVSRKRREVLATTLDGVPVIAESYVRNLRLKTPSSGEKLMLYDGLKGRRVTSKYRSGEKESVEAFTQSMYHETVPAFARLSRVMSTDARRLVKKSVRRKGSEENRNFQEQVESIGGTVYSKPERRRKGNHREIETMDEHPQRRQGIAFHLHGDTSKYHISRHPHYKGDGRLSHPGRSIESWNHASWVKALNMDTYFPLSQDKVTIKDGGLYFVYAQIFYSDKHDINGFKIIKNNELIAQCVVTSLSSTAVEKSNTCFTATIDHIQEGDTVRIQEIGNDRISIFEAGKSFFGMVKLADLKK